MSSHIYDEAHVVISRLIDRPYNNPLGDSAFPLLHRLLGASGKSPRVLDVGCGRGRCALWWAAAGAQVEAFDPSEAMLAEAERIIRETGLSGLVSLHCSSLDQFRSDGKFDLIIIHDVLCYSADRAGDLRLLLGRCRSKGLVSISDYFGDADAAQVRTIAETWGIEAPLSYEGYEQLLSDSGFDVLLLADTTRKYSRHWQDIRKRVAAHRSELVGSVGAAAIGRLERQIDAIEAAVGEGLFGHLWSILEMRPSEPAHD